MTKISARLKPLDPSKGATSRTMAFAAIGGHAFEEGRLVTHTGGRPLTLADAEFLRTARVRDGDPKASLAFDVYVEHDEPAKPEPEAAPPEPPKPRQAAERSARKEEQPQKRAEQSPPKPKADQEPAEPASAPKPSEPEASASAAPSAS